MKLKPFYQLEEFDLSAKVELIKSEYSGRKSPVFDGYKGPFFGKYNDEPCTDWLAMYVFEHGELQPGSSSKCCIPSAPDRAFNVSEPIGSTGLL
jgi:hypothetical protein